MKTIIRTQIIYAVGLFALPFTSQLALAQSCAPGLGMSTSDLIFGVHGRTAPIQLDFTYLENNPSYTFVSPTRIQPTSANHAWVLDGSNLLSLTYNPAGSGGIGFPAYLTGSVVTGYPLPRGNLVAMALAWGHLWVASSNELGTADGFVAPLLLPELGVGGVGSMLFDGTYLWISYPTQGILTKVSLTSGPEPSVTMTQVPLLRATGLNHMTFDGYYLWVAGVEGPTQQTLFKLDPSTGTAVSYASTADAPEALAFDGYSIWAPNQANVARFSAVTGAGTGTYSASDARSVAFDGSQMWVAERSSNSIVPIRACDGAATLKPITTPAYPENVAFDGTNLWITSPTSKTISIR